MTPRFPDKLYMTSLKVRSSTSPLESDAAVLCVRERDRDLDRERARLNNGDRPTWNFSSTLDTFVKQLMNILTQRPEREHAYIPYLILACCSVCTAIVLWASVVDYQ